MWIQILFVLTGVILFSLPAGAASQNPCEAEIVMSFPLATAKVPATVNLGRTFVLKAVASNGGWELGIYRSEDIKHDANFLAPIRNWHGAQPFLITPQMKDVYPNERLIPVRSAATAICVRILDGRLEGNKSDRRYVDGVVEVRWSGPNR